MHNQPQLGIQTVAMPTAQNARGTIFGGWMMGQLDLAGAIIARTLLDVGQEVVTVKATDIIFKKPVYSGDVIQCWVTVVKIGNTSITTKITVTVIRKDTGIVEHEVATGDFIYVSLKDGKPSPIARK